MNSGHISLVPVKDCKNIDTYGTICVKCNDCGRFNVECCICGKVLTPENGIINIEFYDVFCDFACKEHEDLFKKMDTYEGKYLVNMRKKDFLKLSK